MHELTGASLNTQFAIKIAPVFDEEGFPISSLIS